MTPTGDITRLLQDASAGARESLDSLYPLVIVLKALRKEPERRYSSAEQLSENVNVAGVAVALAALGDLEGALRSSEEASGILSPPDSGRSPLPEVRSSMAEVYAVAGEVRMRLARSARLPEARRRALWSEARESLSRGLEIRLTLRRESGLRPPDAGRIDSLTRALALCDGRAKGALRAR